MRQAARVYMETQVTTTSQGQVLIMLYDGAIKFLSQAKERINAKDYAGKGILISNAIDIINELASSLNAEKGGTLAANLNQLYFYCNKRLFMANSRMDTAAIDEVITILGGIRSAYAQIIDTPEAVAAMAQAPIPSPTAQRASAGMHAAPAGAPISAVKVRNAYATQSAAVSSLAEQAHPAEAAGPAPAPEASPPPAPSRADGMTPPAAQTRPESIPMGDKSPAPAPRAKPAAEGEGAPLPALPDLDVVASVPPSLTPNKRMAASGLYRKFAS